MLHMQNWYAWLPWSGDFEAHGGVYFRVENVRLEPVGDCKPGYKQGDDVSNTHCR